MRQVYRSRRWWEDPVLPLQLGTLLLIHLGCWGFISFFLPNPLWKVPGGASELLLKAWALEMTWALHPYHFLYAGLITSVTRAWLTVSFYLERMG